MNILVLNCGSSSIKYQLFDSGTWQALLSGAVERIGEDSGRLKQSYRIDGNELETFERAIEVRDHEAAFGAIDLAMSDCAVRWPIDAIGHRVVHGGETFHCPVRIDASVVDAIGKMIPLAPLHNPPNLEGIEVTRSRWFGLPQVAVFDTAFHQTMPPVSARYAIAENLYREHGVRRYGFHGISHSYVSRRAAAFLELPLERCNLITLHLGNGASACAIRHGKSVDTTMGMTPLEGLVMGTRSGDIDPGIVFYLAREAGLSVDDIDALLNRRSGLIGVCDSNDMREIKQRADAGDPAARLAIDLFCHRLRKTIGAYAAELGRLDAVVFTGGIGGNAAFVRQQTCADLEILNIELDEALNNEGAECERAISSARSGAVLVIPTNEELEIAQLTLEQLT